MLPKKPKKTKENKIAQLLQTAIFLFKEQKIKSPELEAELLLSYVLKKDRVFVLAHPEITVNLPVVTEFNKLIKKRLAGWSSAVLLGSKEFYGLKFFVNNQVLVPRPETELLVDLILEKIKLNNEAQIIDIGTGSGAIISSLFDNLSVNPRISFYASDNSSQALTVARFNIKKHHASASRRINFLKGDLLQPYLAIFKKSKPNNLIIAANLPYLTPLEMSERSISKEPKNALLSGLNGLWHYQRLFSQLKIAKLTKFFLICEINPSQAIKIKKLALSSFPQASTYFKKDYSNQIRFFILEF